MLYDCVCAESSSSCGRVIAALRTAPDLGHLGPSALSRSHKRVGFALLVSGEMNLGPSPPALDLVQLRRCTSEGYGCREGEGE